MTHVTSALPAAGAGDVPAPAEAATGPGRPPSARVIARSLFLLTKPRIIELLLVTTLPTMLLARAACRRLRLIAGHADRRRAGGRQREHAELLHRPGHRRGHEAHLTAAAGGPLAAAAARWRSSPARRWRPASCSALPSTLLLGLARQLARGRSWPTRAILFYVFVYTLGLKRRTASNIVIGGAAGCFPVLVGWAAVTGSGQPGPPSRCSR